MTYVIISSSTNIRVELRAGQNARYGHAKPEVWINLAWGWFSFILVIIFLRLHLLTWILWHY